MIIGADLAGILRGTHGERRRWVGAEWGGVWWGVSPLQPTKGSGGASWAPQAGSGRKRVLAYFEGHRTLLLVGYLCDKNRRGTICTSSQILGGGSVPRDLRPCWWSQIRFYSDTHCMKEYWVPCVMLWYGSINKKLIRRWDSELELSLRHRTRTTKYNRHAPDMAITPFKVIQGHQVWYQSKAHMQFPISD